ncbi:hypothetical protein ACE01N_12930 [Saccharicrinis sp. FJH2]|uniref:hypothetical protein n=1 Tax=Saccharicrinis sp. FJH65 TaxID=3344659 RepID=UPI0035F46880
MFWIKLGILLTGFLYAGLLPHTVRKTLQHVDFDPERQTLSFLSNKVLYGEKFKKGYKRLLLGAALLNYSFFWLLSKHYDLGEHADYMRYIDYSFAFLTILAFIPHNIYPYSFKHLGTTFQRFFHNVFAALVFLTLPVMIITFQVAVLPDNYFLGIAGLVIVFVIVISVFVSVVLNGVNGITEILFINGISIWSIFTTILTIMI